jgi:NAD(P)H-hydrate epimerase
MSAPLYSFPALTAAEMARIDKILIEELGLDVLQVMETAGRAVAHFARARFMAGDPRNKRVVVLAGPGGNGGDGLVAARYLHGWGARVDVLLSREQAGLSETAAHQAHVLDNLGVGLGAPRSGQTLPRADLLIDALLGFGLRGDPSGPASALIRAANAHAAPILAVDVPSGLDATSGANYLPCVQATATLTLALPKSGLVIPSAGQAVGELHVADIGVPSAAYARLGLQVGPLFAQAEIIRLR